MPPPPRVCGKMREKQTDKFLYLLYIFSTFYYPFTVYFVLFFLSSICRLQEIENFSSLPARRARTRDLIPKILLKLIFPTIGRLYSVSRYKQTLSKFQPYLPANKPISHKSTVYLSFRERKKTHILFGYLFTRYFFCGVSQFHLIKKNSPSKKIDKLIKSRVSDLMR